VTRLPDWPVVEPGEHVEGCVLGERHLGACQNTVSAVEPVGELRCLHGQCVEAKAYGKHAQGYTDDDIDRLVARAQRADERLDELRLFVAELETRPGGADDATLVDVVHTLNAILAGDRPCSSR
jgi:hypothetical protein